MGPQWLGFDQDVMSLPDGINLLFIRDVAVTSNV